MLEQSAVHMTEEEIDAYYRQQQEENLKRYYAIQANRAIQEDRGRLIRLVIVTVAALVVCTIFLKLNFQVQQQTYRVAVLQKEIDALRLTNEDAQKRLEDTVDLFSVQKKAEALGMGYPKEENVVYYSVDETDYMFQTGEIPPS
ncbi:MAG: hypothetical protein MR020_03660 [Lachnospiraceae bacterium]|nr:hypothetical protein [Lachnospiraceae bacterium]